MAIIINGATGIDMGNTSVSNASQVDSVIINENGLNVATNNNLVGFKNYIINGKKVVNQRGLTSTDNSYNQDRWYKAGNNWFQGIEGNSNLINGKTYTLSWEGSASASYYVGDATSSTINSQTFIPIENGGSFTLTISAGQNLWIKFESDATGSTFNFVQLEEGSVATPFEQRPYGLELSLCQRYWHTSNVYWAGYAYGSARAGTKAAFPADMRTIPSIIITVNNGISGFSSVGIDYWGLNTKGVTFDKIANTTLLDGRWYIEYIASAEL